MRLVTLSLSLLALVLAAAQPCHADQIYVFRERDGVIRFTNRPPPDGIKADVFTGKGQGLSWYRFPFMQRAGNGKLYRNEYRDIISKASREHNLEEGLIQAVIHVESAFNPNAVSPKGAQGLMQLLPSTARELGVRNSFSPEENVRGGSGYLAFLIRKYNGNLRLALAAYNAGQGAVEAHKGIPPYEETQQYVRTVLSMKDKYSRISNG